MRAKPIILSSAVLLFAGMSFAASFETASHSDVHSKSSQHDHHAGYVKPGAAVAMTHDYDGQTAPGEYETVTLTLSHIYKDGRLSIDMLPTANLQVFSNLPTQDIQLQTGSTLNLALCPEYIKIDGRRLYRPTRDGDYSLSQRLPRGNRAQIRPRFSSGHSIAPHCAAG